MSYKRKGAHVLSLILLLLQCSLLNAGAGEFAGNDILNANPGARAMGAGGASSCLIDSLSI